MIEFKGVSFAYNGQFVLENLSFTVEAGEFMGIIGPNGAGKSTLLKLADRILVPDIGSILLNSKPLRFFNRKDLARIVGFVSQGFASTFRFSAFDIVMMGRFPYQKTLALDSAEDREISFEAMKATDCLSLKDRDFMTLSGGERQRVILASALAQQPKVLLLDEPTTALDLKHQIHFYNILQNLCMERKMTIVSVTHDVNLAAQFCRRIMILKEGKILADGSVKEVIQEDILHHVYDIPIHIIDHKMTGRPIIFPVLKRKE
ncbi:MAG: ABC transporter ATP-binding protein [Calditrichaeota bacterium]|nr:ABC transporter ATP-binding protein [Calditrichota bacterium]RQV93562.1 MAG: ABC transporter ATP-binding protein [bacterium]RQW08518.1 MAG: ABC transporter ATP-binding protein [Calditrichota bacterium]